MNVVKVAHLEEWAVPTVHIRMKERESLMEHEGCCMPKKGDQALTGKIIEDSLLSGKRSPCFQLCNGIQIRLS